MHVVCAVFGAADITLWNQMSQDAELLRCYATEHDEGAFSDLVGRHVDLVYSAASRLVNGDAHRAQDVTQQVFAELARQAGALMRHPALAGWLYTTTRRLAWRTLRTEQRRAAREQQANTMNELLRESPADSQWERLRPLLDDAMHELAEQDRLAVLLRFFKNKSLSEVGLELGLTENTARMRVERALEKLRLALARKSVGSTAAALAVALSGNAIGAAPAGFVAGLAAASLARASAQAAITPGVFKFMAATKLKVGLSALALAGAAITLVVVNQQRIDARADNDALRRQLAQLKADNDDLSRQLTREKRWRALRTPAPPLRAAAAGATDDGSYTNLYDRLSARAATITADKLQDYLKANHRSAASLLAAFRVSRDPALLEEAKKNFPGDPQVAFEAAFQSGVTPEERRQWLDTFEKTAPDNALANYLSALDYFKAGQTDQAIREMAAASGKAQFQDYSMERMQSDEEAYLGAGTSIVEAKQLAGSQLLLPQLGQLKQLGLDMVDLAQSYQQSGDTPSAQTALQMAVNLGQRYAAGSPGEPEISQLVGIALESIALKNMDPSAPYGDNGQTVQDQIAQLGQERAQIHDLAQQVDALLPMMSDQDWIIYKDRWMVFGEQAAVQWIIAKYGQK
ncbi:MAG: sigma-70 family RNA polymerase sigma factor [Verrucomicrobiota bacterium]